RNWRKENISKKTTDFAVHDCNRIEIKQSEITRIHFLEDEDERGKEADVTEQAGNGEKTDPPFEFVEPRHTSGRVKGAVCVFKVAAVSPKRRRGTRASSLCAEQVSRPGFLQLA